MRKMVFDKRGAAPTYVIEDDADGKAIVVNQFTGRNEMIGSRPFSVNEARAAMGRIIRADKETAG